MKNKILKASLDLNWLKTELNYSDKETAKTFLKLKEYILETNKKYGAFYVGFYTSGIDIALSSIRLNITSEQIKEARYNDSIVTFYVNVLDIKDNVFMDDYFDDKYVINLGLAFLNDNLLFKLYIKE